MIYTGEKTLVDLGDKVPKDKQEKVKEASKLVREAIEKDDLSDIKHKTDELKKVLQEIGTEIYKKAGPAMGQEGKVSGEEPSKEEKKEEKEGKAPEAESGEKVVDADFEEVKVEGEEKK